MTYPAEVYDDEDITETGIKFRPGRVSFLRGWNFCTDMYRLLEHIHIDVTDRPKLPSTAHAPGEEVSSFLSRLYPSKGFVSESLLLVSKMHEELPQELKKIKGVTGNAQLDRYGYIGMCDSTNLKLRHVAVDMLTG